MSTADVRKAARSDPADGSLIIWAQRSSPMSIFSRYRALASGEPWLSSEGPRLLAGRRMPSHANIVLIRMECCNPANTP